VKPAEVQWRFLQAVRRALDGPEFKSPAVGLARTLWRLRQALIADQAPTKKKAFPRFYGYAIERYQDQLVTLLPLVSVADLSKALIRLEKADFGIESAEKVVLEAYWRIFERTGAEPKGGLAVYKEIEAMAKGESNVKLPWESTVYAVLNRLELPTGQSKRGPKRGPRPRKTSKKRA
jgi:hypothetical protein